MLRALRKCYLPALFALLVNGCSSMPPTQGTADTSAKQETSASELSLTTSSKSKKLGTQWGEGTESIEDSDAANSAVGSVKNTGIIGTAVFELNNPDAPVKTEDQPKAFPADEPGFAPPPNYKR